MTATAQTATPNLTSVPKAEATATMAKAAAETAAAAEARIADTVLSTQRQISDITLAFANEVMGFASRRIQAQADFMTRLSRCTDPADLLDTQLRFVADTTNDYASEMTTLAKVVQPKS